MNRVLSLLLIILLAIGVAVAQQASSTQSSDRSVKKISDLDEPQKPAADREADADRDAAAARQARDRRDMDRDPERAGNDWGWIGLLGLLGLLGLRRRRDVIREDIRHQDIPVIRTDRDTGMRKVG
jgi:MYXO-CTERM domain-containing protein